MIRKTFIFAVSLPVACSLVAFPFLAASGKTKSNSVLPVEQEAQIRKANRLVRSGKSSKAQEKYQTALSTAKDVSQCLAIAEGSEKFGHPLMDVRRDCLQKALTLGSTPQDFFQIALKARQYQFFEITKSAIDFLIANANTNDELFELAEKAQGLALNDVAQMAMAKAYVQTKSVPDALNFAKRAKVMSMDDLVRKTIKDLIDDEPDAQNLCDLLEEIEPFQLVDLNRYLLRKAVYAGKTVADCKAVFEAAKRHAQPDIVNLAAYRGRKLLLLQQNQDAGVQAALEAQEQRAANDLARPRRSGSSAKPAPATDNGPGF